MGSAAVGNGTVAQDSHTHCEKGPGPLVASVQGSKEGFFLVFFWAALPGNVASPGLGWSNLRQHQVAYAI